MGFQRKTTPWCSKHDMSVLTASGVILRLTLTTLKPDDPESLKTMVAEIAISVDILQKHPEAKINNQIGDLVVLQTSQFLPRILPLEKDKKILSEKLPPCKTDLREA